MDNVLALENVVSYRALSIDDASKIDDVLTKLCHNLNDNTEIDKKIFNNFLRCSICF